MKLNQLKKTAAGLLSAATVLSLMGVVAAGNTNEGDAYDTFQLLDNSRTVYLEKGQTHSDSENVTGDYKSFGGVNSATSGHSVHFIPRYTRGFGWYSANSQTVPPNGTLGETRTTTQKNATWYLQLDPEGPRTSDCKAKGYIRLVSW